MPGAAVDAATPMEIRFEPSGRTAAWYDDELAGFEEYTGPLFAAAVRVGKPYRSSDKEIWFELSNASDIPFYLVKGPQGAPADLSLPAGSTVIVKADKRYLAEPLSYEVRNVLVGTGRCLAVKLRIPAA